MLSVSQDFIVEEDIMLHNIRSVFYSNQYSLIHRLISLNISPRPDIQCDAVAWRLVGLLGVDQGTGLRARTARLASALVHYTQDSRETVDSRRRQLDAAVQG